MRKILVSILFLLVLSYIGPGFCTVADDDRYKRPDIDIVDFDEPDATMEEDYMPEITDDLLEDEPVPEVESKPSTPTPETVKEIPTPEAPQQKINEPIPEVPQIVENTQTKSTTETATSDQDATQKVDLVSDSVLTPPNPTDDSQKAHSTEPAKNPEETAQPALNRENVEVPTNDQGNKQDQEKNDKPVNTASQQPTVNVKPPSTPAPQAKVDVKPQQTQGAPTQQAQAQPQAQAQQGQPAQKGQTPPPTQQGPKVPPNNQKVPPQGPAPTQTQAAQPRPPVNSGKPGPTNQAPPQGQPAQQPEAPKPTIQQAEIVKEVNERVEAPQVQERPVTQESKVETQEKVVDRKIPEPQATVKAPQETVSAANKPTDASTHKQTKPQNDYVGTEEDYLRLITGVVPDAYIDQYKSFSETFYSNLEHLTLEVLLPFYKQIRANNYLSLGLSSFVVLYFVITVFKTIASLFRKKPKFRYNKEETVSYSDINNNFKKFLAEVDTLKKQIEANAKKGGSTSQVGQAGEATASNAAIPQNLQDEISYIAQNLSRNDELLNKVTKDKRHIDAFLVEFQKEVVESHKAIWNELYQLRKLFSLGKLNVSTSSAKSRAETRDSDETKSLSSNPEVNEAKRKDEPRLVATNKITSEPPRSKSVLASENSGARSRKPAHPIEKKTQDVPPRKPSLVQNGEGVETHAQEVPLNKEEEPQREAYTTAPTIEKTAFRKLSRDEDIQSTIIPTNEKGTLNPFGAQNLVNANPPHNVIAKPGPFGTAARKLSNKLSAGRPSSIPDIDQTVNALSKAEPSSDVRTGTPGLVVNAQNLMSNNPEVSTIEQSQEKSDENTLEESKPSDQVPQTDDTQANTNEETEASSEPSSTSKTFVPPMRTGPMIGMNAGGMRGKPGIPTNKVLPVPGVRRPGPPGANVFKGPPGNLPRPGGPTPIKQPTGQVQEGTSNSQV